VLIETRNLAIEDHVEAGQLLGDRRAQRRELAVNVIGTAAELDAATAHVGQRPKPVVLDLVNPVRIVEGFGKRADKRRGESGNGWRQR
jgi:hypothetical protein